MPVNQLIVNKILLKRIEPEQETVVSRQYCNTDQVWADASFNYLFCVVVRQINKMINS